jgi:hypothetical protein
MLFRVAADFKNFVEPDRVYVEAMHLPTAFGYA